MTEIFFFQIKVSDRHLSNTSRIKMLKMNANSPSIPNQTDISVLKQSNYS